MCHSSDSVEYSLRNVCLCHPPYKDGMDSGEAEYLPASVVSEQIEEETGFKINSRSKPEEDNRCVRQWQASRHQRGRPSMVPPWSLAAAARKINLEQASGNDLYLREQRKVIQDIVAATVHSERRDGD